MGASESVPEADNIGDFIVKDASGADHPLAQYLGSVVLVVNTARACGFAPQQRALIALHEKHAKDGFHVLAFPCNQFLSQEPGDICEIVRETDERYPNRKFPIMAKIDVNGASTAPLYAWMKRTPAAYRLWGNRVLWNYEKFLIDRNGHVIARYYSATKPSTIDADIVTALARPVGAPSAELAPTTDGAPEVPPAVEDDAVDD